MNKNIFMTDKMNCFKVAKFLSTLKLNAVSANRLSTSSQLYFMLNQTKLDYNEKSPQNSPGIKLPFSESKEAVQNTKAENISRAMSYYLEKLAERESLIKFKTEEFEIGKRHLAKMMGENLDSFTQDDINRAIEYLLPSGLFEKKARPFLKNPEDYYPKSKMAAFGRDGRPIHHLFFTGNPEFYQELTQKYLDLNKLEDAMSLIKSKIRTNQSESDTKINLTGSVWISRNELCKKLNTKIDEFSYTKFIILLEKLAQHPLSKKEQVYINQFLTPFEPIIKLNEIPSVLKDDKGRQYQEVEDYLNIISDNFSN
ncbi:28S ribosomal mitochondrial [Brachionus plicatilis]|uniref:28S ribosomal mitochondrial n=1 Tax=Brachionus plicatilis TaxID=10195 RepID=A0A3M7RYU9_BRAPC|nr:28S ribosomal mitochondrial [Brachionus plicatilis]